MGEANEIYEAGNTWLTYGPPLQLARFGMQDQIFDMIDEAKLPPSQIKTFCEALLGCPSPSWISRRFSPLSTRRWLSSRMCSTQRAERCGPGSRRTSSRPNSAE